jgi:hypothetical protein
VSSGSSVTEAEVEAAHPTTSASWDQQRWVGILDRIEYRHLGIGLRFWGPPLSIEVTMSGPDSTSWSTAAAGGLAERSWNWHSSVPCPHVAQLIAGGADDDTLLDVVSRYTLENLILNSLHEIGEWLRFDARRLFPAHGAWDARAGVKDPTQGNGVVHLEVEFDRGQAARTSRGPAPSLLELVQLRARAMAEVPPWRFSYLPTLTISYGASGPTLADSVDRRADPVAWEWPWSASTIWLADAPAADLTAAVQRDVHLMLATYEADRICRAFFVDGRQPWCLAMDGADVDQQAESTVDGPVPVHLAIVHLGAIDARVPGP